MCIIAVDYTGLSREWWDAARHMNPDGVGFAFHERGNTRRVVGMNVGYKSYRKVRNRFDGPILVHFRLATSGPTTVRQCHPFVIGPDVVFAHNGWFLDLIEDDRSDTQVLAEDILHGQDPRHPKLATSLHELCRKGDKLVFLCRGEPIIFGEQHGQWDGQNWYSYRPCVAPYGFDEPVVGGCRVEWDKSRNLWSTSVRRDWDGWGDYDPWDDRELGGEGTVSDYWAGTGEDAPKRKRSFLFPGGVVRDDYNY